MHQRYWSAIFTGSTWEEFRKNGSEVMGFPRDGKLLKVIKPGDYFICYLSRVSRFIAVLEVKSELYQDKLT